MITQQKAQEIVAGLKNGNIITSTDSDEMISSSMKKRNIRIFKFCQDRNILRDPIYWESIEGNRSGYTCIDNVFDVLRDPDRKRQ